MGSKSQLYVFEPRELGQVSLCLFPHLKSSGYNHIFRDFPGSPVVKNLPYNAVDAGSIPAQGTKIPRASGQLSLCTTTTKLVYLSLEPACRNTDSTQPKINKLNK